MRRQVDMRRYIGAFTLVYLLCTVAAAAIWLWLGRERMTGYSGLVMVAVFAAADRFFVDHGRVPGRREARRFARGAVLAAVPVTLAGMLAFDRVRHGPVDRQSLQALRDVSATTWAVLSVLLALFALIAYPVAVFGIRWCFQWSASLRVRAGRRRQRARDGAVSP